MKLNLLKGFNRIWVVGATGWWIYILGYVPWKYGDLDDGIFSGYLKSYSDMFNNWIGILYFLCAPLIVYALIRAAAFAVVWIARGFKSSESN